MNVSFFFSALTRQALHLHQIRFGNEGEVVVAYYFAYSIDVAAAHHEHQLSSEVKAVHILDADAFLRKEINDGGEVGSQRVDADGNDIIDGYEDAILLQHRIGFLLIGGDEAHDTVIAGIGNRGADDVNISLAENGQQFTQAAELILEEEGYLFDGHSGMKNEK